jgi:hypothetical protein
MIWRVWGFPNMLHRLRRSRPPTRGEMLRGAMRTAEGGRPVTEDDFAELLAREPRGPWEARAQGYARETRDMLRDGTPYEQSGAHENDWRL